MSNIPAELMQQFLRVDKRYSINPNEEPFFDMPTSLNLEKLVYEQPTAEEISAAAEAKLLIDYNKSKNKINETYTKTMDKITVRKTAAQNDTLVAKQKVDDELAKTKAEISAEMLSRGLARSSVFAEAVSKAESDAQSAKDELDWRLELTIDGLEDEEADALAVKTAAIASLDDVYEDELAQEIAEMTQKAQDEANDVAKYNNSVEQDEANYKKSWTTCCPNIKKAIRLILILCVTKKLSLSYLPILLLKGVPILLLQVIMLVVTAKNCFVRRMKTRIKLTFFTVLAPLFYPRRFFRLAIC